MVQPDSVCAYCRRRPADPAWRPFCSERCKLVDLGGWFGDRYGIPSDEAPDDPER